MSNSRIHFLTFAAGNLEFEKARKRIARDAINSNFFDHIYAMNEVNLFATYPDFRREHNSFIDNNSRGYGLWIWKPFLILQKLEEIQNNDILVYLDAGCEINYRSRQSRRQWEEYIRLAASKEILAFQMRNNQYLQYPKLSEKCWTRIDLVQSIGIASEDLESNQIEANVIFFKSTPDTRSFVKDWYFYCISNNKEWLKDPDPSNRFQEFIDHRHDQSIFSALFKKRKYAPEANSNYFAPFWNKGGRNYPIWTARNRSGESLVKRFYF